MEIIFDVLSKPIEKRIIEAACIYWEVDKDYFREKTEESTHVHRRSIVYYLLKTHTIFSYKSLAEMFGFLSHQPVMRSVDNIEAHKNIYKQTADDIKMIMKIANKLNAKLLKVKITLETCE